MEGSGFFKSRFPALFSRSQSNAECCNGETSTVFCNEVMACPGIQAILDELASQPLVYAANIRQSAGGAPIENSVAKNTLGATNWKRTAAGTYTLQIIGAFPDPDKVIIHTPTNTSLDAAAFFQVRWLDADTIELATRKLGGTLEDSHMMNGAYFVVEVYP